MLNEFPNPSPGRPFACGHLARVRTVSRRLVLLGALWVAVCGVAGTVGWSVTPPGGVRHLAGAAAFGLLASGLSLLVALPEAFRNGSSVRGKRSRRWRPAAIALGTLALVAGVVGLLLDGGLPEALRLPQRGQSALLAAAGLALVAWRVRRLFRTVQVLTGLLGIGGWFLLLLGAYGLGPAGEGWALSFSLVPVAMPLAAAGLLALRPFEGIMKLAVGARLAGRMFRRLVPLALVLPPLITVFRLAVAPHLPASAAWAMAFLTLVLLVGLIWISVANARTVDVVDRERRQQQRRAEHHFREAELALNRARTFFEGAPVSMVVLSADGLIESMNRKAERVFGWERAALIGKRLDTLAVLGDGTPWPPPPPTSLGDEGSGEGAERELRCRRRDGTRFPAEGGYRISRRGDHVLTVVHLQDISVRKRFEEQLAQREQRLLEAQRLGRLGYWDWDAESDTVTWSEGLCEILGRSADAGGTGIAVLLDSFTPEGREILEQALATTRDEGVHRRLELTVTGTPGSNREVWASVAVRMGADGQFAGLFGTIQDITEAKAIRLALEDSSDRLRLATQAAQIGVWRWLAEDDRLEWDDRTREIYGATAGRLTSADWWAAVHPEDAPRLRGEFQAAIAGAGGLHTEFRIVLPGGGGRQVRCDGIVQADSHGHVLSILGTHLDVTVARESELRLRRSEGALRESEERFRLAFESAGIGMALISPAGRWLKANRTLCGTLGYAEEELLSRTCRDLTHPEDCGQDEALEAQVLAGDLRTYQRSKRFLGRRGNVVWALVTVALVRDAEQRPLYFVSMVEDITQRRETENRVKTLNDQLRGILQFSPSLVTLFDRDGRYLLVSRSVEAALEKPSAEITGRLLEEVLPAEPAAQFRQRLERLAATRTPFVVEDVQARGGEPRAYLTTLFPLFDAAGRHVASGGVAADISCQRKAQQIAEDALREKEILLQEIHHRVKNNLQIISSLLQLESRAVADPQARERFEDCQGRVQAMALIHERLYRTGDLSCIDLGSYLESLAGQIIRSFGRVPAQMLKPIEVTVGPVAIEAAVPCGLIVAELVTNAMKHAFPDQRRGEMAIRLVPDSAGWVLSVEDNGVGAGSGAKREGSLGLKLVNALARQLRGRVEVAGDSGMAVKVLFPAPIDPPTEK